MRIQRLLLIGIGLLIGLGFGWLILSDMGFAFITQIIQPTQEVSKGYEVLEVGPQEGSLAPDFTLQNLNGEDVKLSGLRGRPILINFWATWCAPCRLEMPIIQERYDALFPQLVVLAINFDEPVEQVRGFAEELNLTFDVLLDPGGEVNQKLYRVLGYPSSFFIDSEGVIQQVHIGLLTADQLDNNLKKVGLD